MFPNKGWLVVAFIQLLLRITLAQIKQPNALR